ncbi:efflux RND transporter periplasmic adaptor subunit [Actibacterium lipolyticum]|uniref:Macrolide export protein MacA n=1 Tax=Actibacterium lipolyticum TaxID=1524263 RepID=A0A238JUN5_9RHOB|nr:efflux RND transporter periplasmic adaptor subunit [Actibacterium lipolyticum]SMX34295.1 Macrolide export protein MacA [Actibacterium lipolyticum]
MNEKRESIEKTLKLGKHRSKVPLWAKLLGGGVVVAFAVWFFALRPDTTSAVNYVSEKVTRGDLSVTVSATGTVEPTNLVEVSSELSGTLASVEVDYNDRVEVGQVLARLDSAKLEALYEVQKAALVAAEARVEQAQTNLHEAFDNFEIARTLDERGVTTHQAFSAAEATLERNQAALQIADADRALAAANLDLYGADLAKAVITAPIKGIILERNADPGQIVASSLSAPVLFTIAEDLASMELQVDVDEADIGRIAVGNKAIFTVDAYDDETFPAEITKVRFTPEEAEGVVTYKAILIIDNSDLRLRPGMTATADIVVAELRDVLRVPNAALRFEPPQVAAASDGENSGSGLLGLIMPDPPDRNEESEDKSAKTVWVLRDGVAEEIEIVAGQSDGDQTAVLGGELAAGDVVITDQTEAN